MRSGHVVATLIIIIQITFNMCRHTQKNLTAKKPDKLSHKHNINIPIIQCTNSMYQQKRLMIPQEHREVTLSQRSPIQLSPRINSQLAPTLHLNK